MATQQLTNISGILKQQYIGKINKLLNNLSVAWSRLDKTSEGISLDGTDLTAKIPTHYQANQGVGWRSEGGTLPTPLQRLHQFMTIAPAYVYGTFKVSGQAKAASRGPHAFAKVVVDNMKGMTDELKLEMNRALWGRGTGAYGRIGTGTTAVADGTAFAVVDASKLSPGMVIDTFTTNAASGGTAGFDSKTIETVNWKTNEITMVEDLSGANNEANDYIYREDSRGKVMMGYEGIIDGADSTGAQLLTTFQGITRATYPQYQAFVYDAGGATRPLEFDLIQQAYEAPEFLGSGGAVSAIYSKPAMRRRYLDKCMADRRYVKSMTFDMGWSAVEYTGGSKPVPWFAEQMCPANSIYFINENEVAVFEAQKFQWLHDEGAGALRFAGTTDEFEAAIGGYYNVGSFRPNTSSVLRDVA